MQLSVDTADLQDIMDYQSQSACVAERFKEDENIWCGTIHVIDIMIILSTMDSDCSTCSPPLE